MAGTKTSALAALTTVADGDLLPIVDISDTTQAPTGSTKRVTVANLVPAASVADMAAVTAGKFVTPSNLPWVYVGPTGDLTGVSDDVNIAAARAKLAAGTAQGITFGPGRYYITAALDFSNDDDFYSISLTGLAHGGGPSDSHGTQIEMLTDNVPIIKCWGAQCISGLSLIYNSQQAIGDTAAVGLEMNNLAGARITDVAVWQANISFGIPQSAFGATSYNGMFNSDLSGLRSYKASLTHFDLRNFNGGGTNCRLGPLYVNGGGSLDFVTPGQSCSYGLRFASASGFEIGAVSVDGVIINERLLDVAAGNNTIEIGTIRAEAVDWKKDNDGLIGLGGSANTMRIGAVIIKNTRWTASVLTAMYIFRTNATTNLLYVGSLAIEADCDFGASGTRRALTNSSVEAGGDIQLHSISDPNPEFTDTIWGDSITTLQTPVRIWKGRFVNGYRQAHRSANIHRVVVNTSAAPTTGTWAVDDECILDVITNGLPVAYRCVTAGTPGTWRPISQTVKRDTTANRPAPAAHDVGIMYLDNTLDADGKPIWWNGTAWVDATGATV